MVISQDCFLNNILFFNLPLQRGKKIMGLPMRITYKDADYVYEILNSSAINKTTVELHISFSGHDIVLIKDEKNVWVQDGGGFAVEPELAQALGRSVSLRFRM